MLATRARSFATVFDVDRVPRDLGEAVLGVGQGGDMQSAPVAAGPSPRTWRRPAQHAAQGRNGLILDVALDLDGGVGLVRWRSFVHDGC
jgi:hypothetical protein